MRYCMEEGVQQAVNMVQSMGIVEMEVFKVCGKVLEQAVVNRY